MKFYALFFLTLTLTLTHAQNKITANIASVKNKNWPFPVIAPLTKSEIILSTAAQQVVAGATYATINQAVITDLIQNKYQAILLKIPYGNQELEAELVQINPFSEGFHIDTDKSKNIPYNRGVHYRGIIKNNPHSVVAFNFFEGECNGIISDKVNNNLVIGRLSGGNTSHYIVYSDANMLVPNGVNCHVKDGPADDKPAEGSMQRNTISERCVTTYFEMDHDLYLANDSDLILTTNWMTSVFNNVQTIFAIDGITVALKSVFIWTETDPYQGDSSVEYLFQFNDLRPVFDGDVGQLVGLDPGGLGGVAVTIDGLCSQNNFSYADVDINFQTIPTFSWTILVITHELGHLLGSRHTHACAWNGDNTSIDGCGTQAGYQEGNCDIGPIPSEQDKGTIMSYCHLIGGVGISLANGFGPQPAEAILFKVETSTCLSTDCINTCINTITGINASNVMATSATLNWEDISQNASSYQVAVSPLSSGASNFFPVTGSSVDLTGLEPNTFYLAELKPICENAESVIRQKIFATAANWCDGVTITDTGGTFNDYGDMESYTRVLIPNLPAKAIQLQFTQFSLELDYDYLYIYDGPNTASPELTGGLTGAFNPGVFTSTSADGALTLKFTSDQYITDSGYIALIGCEENLGVSDSQQFLDFRYYPNPTNQFIQLLSNQAFTDVKIYNLQGRLLYEDQATQNETKIDMAAFATGTYFFKVNVGDKQINFKVVRN